MRKLVLFPLLIIMALAARAQNHGAIKAIILDSASHEPVQLATISLLKLSDTSLISYTVTDKNGAFTLHNLKQEPSRLLISHVSYQGLHLSVDFKKGVTVDLGKLYLSIKMLQEVTVKGERIPVIIKKDTIEFDAMAFKTRPNALVIDLLKKLPGVEVDRERGITVNGRDVSKIRVNGKDFFVNDPSIATNSLEAELISKVQVYDDRDDDPDHIVPENQVKKIINLKFKKSFAKGVLSTLSAGAGTQSRYVANGFAAKYSDALQLAAKIGTDNLSNTGLFSGNYGGFGIYSFGSGLSKSTTGNFDFTQDLTKKSKLHIEYSFRNTISDNNSNSSQQQNISDTIINTLSYNLRHQRANDQNFQAQYVWTPDTINTIKFSPHIGYDYNSSQNSSTSIKSNNFVPLLNTILSTDNGDNKSFQYTHSFSFHHMLKRKWSSISLGNSISVQPNNGIQFNTNDFTSFVAGLASDTLKRSSKNLSRDVSEVINGGLHYPITKKLIADVAFISLHDRNRGEVITYDQDLKTGQYNIFLQNQSSNLIRSLWGESLSPELTYNFTGDISMKVGLNAMAQQIGNHFNNYTDDLNQNFFYLFPSAEIRFKGLVLSYSEFVQQPSINNLQPITIVYSQLYTFTGNPDLKPTYLHYYNLEYRPNKFSPGGLNFNINAHLVAENNTVITVQTINAEGATVSSPINRNGRFTGYLNGYVSKNFKKQGKWQFYTSTNVNANAAHNFFIVNQQNGYQNTQSLQVRQQFGIQWNDLVSIDPSYGISYSTSQYKLVNYPNVNYTTQTAGIAADVSLPEKFRWRADYSHIHNSFAAPGFQQNSNMLNFTVSRRIQAKDRGEIGLACYDLLNQNASLEHSVFANSVTYEQRQVLKRYILLSYTYHFKQFK